MKWYIMEVYKYGRYTADQTAAHLNVIQVFQCICLFSFAVSLPFLSSFSVTVCQLSHVLCMSPTQTDVCCGHISLLSNVLCHPVVSDPRFNHGWTFLQASSLPLVSVHNSLCGRTSQSGATAGLSRSCSGFDLSPFTYDLSHCSSLPVKGAERDITAKNI